MQTIPSQDESSEGSRKRETLKTVRARWDKEPLSDYIELFACFGGEDWSEIELQFEKISVRCKSGRSLCFRSGGGML